MTSGGQPTALAGMAVIARLIERAGSRIEILPAGGIRPDNIQRIIATTGCTQVHTSLRDPRRPPQPSLSPLSAVRLPPAVTNERPGLSGQFDTKLWSWFRNQCLARQEITTTAVAAEDEHARGQPQEAGRRFGHD